MNKDVFPVAVGFGWSASLGTPFSAGIRFITRKNANPFSAWARWSHMFIIFRFADNTTEIHEALGSSGWCRKDGKKFDDWKKKRRGRNIGIIRWLPIDTPKVEEIYKNSLNDMGKKSYAWKQIGSMLAANTIIGRWLNLSVKANRDTVVCSEQASRKVWEICPEWDLRSDKESSFDGLDPQQAFDNYEKLVKNQS